ncbi:hypothetical protein GO491_03755 [Flavobacteriaceae bacterium Ap0902]|nr:hypothetical protein [Flavobacteriaceae bacterium Ap0902]
MKKIAVLFLIMMITLSCSSDDDSIRSQLSGQWRLMSADLMNFGSQDTIDYSGDNIIYNFKNNGKLIITGNDDIAHATGEYYYKINNNQQTNDPNNKQENNLYVHINNTAWALTMTEDAMTLSTSYVDGPALNFVRK